MDLQAFLRARGSVPKDPTALHRAAALMTQLAPEQAFLPTRMEMVQPGITTAQLEALTAVKGERVLLFFRAGRYLLDDTFDIQGADGLALVAEPGAELFSERGKAVVRISASKRVLIHGMYMNHYAPTLGKGYHVRSIESMGEDCADAYLYQPRIKRSNVVEILKSSQVSVRSSELMGSGFIGILAKGSKGIHIEETVLHDCISEGIRLESSVAVAHNVLVFDTGNKAFKGKCRGEDCGWARGGRFKRFKSPRFVTAVTVDSKSTLTATRSTFINAEPLDDSRIFHVGGTLFLKDSVVVHPRAAVVVPKRTKGTVTVADSCLTAKALPETVARAGWVRFGQAIGFPSPVAGQVFVNEPSLPPECAEYGARLPKNIVPVHLKP